MKRVLNWVEFSFQLTAFNLTNSITILFSFDSSNLGKSGKSSSLVIIYLSHLRKYVMWTHSRNNIPNKKNLNTFSKAPTVFLYYANHKFDWIWINNVITLNCVNEVILASWRQEGLHCVSVDEYAVKIIIYGMRNLIKTFCL